uniref:Uncharacterized protein n=1 Tax=Rhizophora mucronata TaxID=61149 RepID=A0A2P2NZ02_RHIMU
MLWFVNSMHQLCTQVKKPSSCSLCLCILLANCLSILANTHLFNPAVLSCFMGLVSDITLLLLLFYFYFYQFSVGLHFKVAITRN